MCKDGEEEVDQKKRLIDCVRQDMTEMAVNDEMTSDRGEWWKRTCCADPKWDGKRVGRRRSRRSWIFTLMI
jgi:hypothetical protein